MSLRKRWFGPEWQHRDAERRARAVSSANDAALLDQLPEIARTDTDEAVRLAALKRLNSEAVWRQAHAGDTAARVRDAARHALIQHLLHSEDAGERDQRVSWIESLGDRELSRRAAREARDRDLRRALLENIQAQGFLGDCAVSEADDELAEFLIGRIEQSSTLDRIAPAIKKRSKRRHQALLARRAALQGEVTGRAADTELRSRLIVRAERLARGDNDGDRKATAEELDGEWKTLGPCADETLQRRFEGAMRIVRQSFAPRPSTTATAAASGTSEPAAPALPPELVSLGDQATALATQPLTQESEGVLNQLISTFDRFRNQHLRGGDALQDEFKRIQALIGELQARVEARRTAESKPSTANAKKPSASDAGSGSESDPGDSIRQRLLTAEAALDAGNLTAAWTALGDARRPLDRLHGRQRPQKLVADLGRLGNRLREMRDWLHWSNNELRERLIERVGEIDTEALHPDAVTARLKELRSRWNELEQAERMPGEKRRHTAPQGQWRRFQKACQQAFDAAKPYLEQRSEVRQAELKELQQFIEEAQAVAADRERNGRDLLRYQRAAREAIRNLDALPPRKRGEMATALRSLMDALSSGLDRHFEAIADEKRRLIAEARKLVHERERDQAIERAKALQAAWKQAGRTRRKLDDQLWREFREPIDPLFADLEQARDQHLAEQQARTDAMTRLCEQAEELAAAQDPQAAAGPMNGLREAFEQAGRPPGALRNRFEHAVARHEARLSDLHRADARRQQAGLEKLADAVQQGWEALAAGEMLAEVPEPEADLIDDPVYASLRERLDTLQNPSRIEAFREQVGSNASAARAVVIEMECISGLETPAPDQEQRMAVQVRRLSDRLGRGSARPDLDAERMQLRRRWYDSLPHDPALHKELARRFRAAEEILDQMSRGS